MDNEKALLQRPPKPLIEACPISLDVERLISLGVVIPGASTSRTIYWTNSTGEKIFTIWLEAHLVHPSLSWIELRFLVTDAEGNRREAVQTVAIARTYPGFGKVRYWFVDSGRRVGRLYLPEGADQFRSRHVHGLAYATQRITKSERKRRRDAKIRARLCVDPTSTGIPSKPTRMRWRTYYRLIRPLRREQTRAALEYAKRLLRFSG